MFDTVIEMLSYPFMTRAFLVGSLVALCSALLGVSLVLKRYSMIGDGLSHVGFGAMAIAAAMNAAPLTVAIPVVIVAAILLLRISGNAKIKGDAAIALISTTSLAVGVMVISLTTGMNTDVYNYMFGSVLSMTKNDVIISIILSILLIAIYVFFYNRLFMITFDERYAKVCGINVTFYQFLISLITAIVVVLGMRMMGTLLISSLIVFPAIIARKLTNSFKNMVILSILISVICFIFGILISYYLNLPTGACIVTVYIVSLLIANIFKKINT